MFDWVQTVVGVVEIRQLMVIGFAKKLSRPQESVAFMRMIHGVIVLTFGGVNRLVAPVGLENVPPQLDVHWYVMGKVRAVAVVESWTG